MERKDEKSETTPPRQREKHVTGDGLGVHKGKAVGGGPVGGGVPDGFHKLP